VTDPTADAGTRYARLRSRELRTPLRERAGLRYLEHGPGRLDEAMDIPPWLRDADGGVSPSALLILADSTLAAAAGTSIGPEQVHENAAGASVTLSDDTLAAIDDAIGAVAIRG
jgi:hypothetical protein